MIYGKISSREFSEHIYGPRVIGYSSLDFIVEESYVMVNPMACSMYKPFSSGSVNSLKSMGSLRVPLVATIFSLGTWPKVSLAIVQGISVFVINMRHGYSCYSTVHEHVGLFLVRAKSYLETCICSDIPRAGLSGPIPLRQAWGKPRVHESKKTTSERDVGNRWTYGIYGLSFNMVRHRFSPVRFASWAFEALTMTMQSLYSSALEVCYR